METTNLKKHGVPNNSRYRFAAIKQSTNSLFGYQCLEHRGHLKSRSPSFSIIFLLFLYDQAAFFFLRSSLKRETVAETLFVYGKNYMLMTLKRITALTSRPGKPLLFPSTHITPFLTVNMRVPVLSKEQQYT